MGGNILNFFKKDKKDENSIFNSKETHEYHVALCIPKTGIFLYANAALSILSMSCPPAVKRSLFTLDVEPINRCREMMVEDALKNETTTHVLMIEPDLKLHPGTIWELIAPTADIVVLSSFLDAKPFTPTIYNTDFTPYIDFEKSKHRFVNIGCTDPGCLLIKRSVFEQMPKPWFNFGADGSSDIYNFTKLAYTNGFNMIASTKCFADKMTTMTIGYKTYREYQDYLGGQNEGA